MPLKRHGLGTNDDKNKRRQLKAIHDMTFQKKTKAHLASYKESHLKKPENGTWRGRKYKHILPNDDASRYLNLLPGYREKIKHYINIEKVSLHYAFHHLNSSQAMCLNFFYPLYHNKSLECITKKMAGMSNEKINYDTVSFEKKGKEKGYGIRPTFFDFYFETKSNKKFYFEIKYTESGFGQGKANNERYKSFYARQLGKILNGSFDKQIFYKNYQIFRNLIHVDDHSYVVFVYPEKNTGVKRGISKGKKLLSQKYQKHLIEITWEDLYTSLTNQNVIQHLSGFKDKYFL